MRGFDRVLSFDPEHGQVEVEAGIQWPALFLWPRRIQGDDLHPWAVAQKQTGADRFTIGGSLGANIHGRGLAMRPIIADVKAFTLVDAIDNCLRCSRQENCDLFRLAIGGDGLFGVIATVTLRLAPRRMLRREVEIADIGEVILRLTRCAADGFLYGNFQFAIDERDPDFLRRSVLSCCRPIADTTQPQGDQLALSAADWSELLRLAHTDKLATFARHACFYLTYHRHATAGQVAAAYPRFREFLAWKRTWDPNEQFQSEWYRHHRALFAAEADHGTQPDERDRYMAEASVEGHPAASLESAGR